MFAHNLTPKNRSIRVDAIRGLAILGVISVHSIQNANLVSGTIGTDLVTEVLSFGRYGVELFFFISGWLLTSNYTMSKSNVEAGYWRRRIGRIYPLWTLFLVISIITGYLFSYGGIFKAISGSQTTSFGEDKILVVVLMALTFTLFLSPNLWNTVIPGGWSIQVEVLHYLLFPFMKRIGLQRTIWWVTSLNIFTFFLVLLQSSNSSTYQFLGYIIDTWIRLGLNSSLSFFTIGIIACHLLKSGQRNLDYNIRENFPQISLFALSFLFAPCPFGKSIEAIGFVVISITVVASRSENRIDLRLLATFGKYSYFIYFFHFICIDIFAQLIDLPKLRFIGDLGHTQLFAAFFLFSACVSLPCGWLSMRFVEVPSMKFVNRFSLAIIPGSKIQ